MNLQRMTWAGLEPFSIQAALRRRFTVVTRQNDCRVWPYKIEASDDRGRVRLRIAYFWSEQRFRWIYLIQPGDRP